MHAVLSAAVVKYVVTVAVEADYDVEIFSVQTSLRVHQSLFALQSSYLLLQLTHELSLHA